MSVIHTRSYEITKFSDICDLIYSFNQSHPKLTHIVIHSPSHNSYHSHSQSHSPNHSINDAIILRSIKTHNHSILHKNVLMSVIQTTPYEITKFSDICNFIYPLNQSHTHAHSYSYSLTHHHTIHTNRTISHIHPITWSTMLSFVDAHKHTITLYHMKMFPVRDIGKPRPMGKKCNTFFTSHPESLFFYSQPTKIILLFPGSLCDWRICSLNLIVLSPC